MFHLYIYKLKSKTTLADAGMQLNVFKSFKKKHSVNSEHLQA